MKGDLLAEFPLAGNLDNTVDSSKPAIDSHYTL